MNIISNKLKISSLKRLVNSIEFNFLKISLCIVAFFYTTNSIWAYDTDSLFKSDEIIKMELRTDFSAIQDDRPGNAEYHEGELVYYTPGGETIKLSVKVIVRGHFRRDTANCNFPPLYIHFKKNEVQNTVFENQNKLKLVTPCQYEKDVIDEYLIYKMYNQVTDLSFKVRLVKMLYFDSVRGKKVFEKYSFFIEEKEHAAERNNYFVKDIFAKAFDLNKENFKRMSVFEYIVGNIDWYFSLKHNIIIMQPNDTTLAPSAVPFDFDLSGFVDADYAKRKSKFDELLPSGRVYKGLCYKADEFDEIFEFYRKLRPVFESIINNMEFISKSTKKSMIKYIEYFYKVIENNKLIKREFLDVCETTADYKILIR
jgi:hypothetical protein